MSAGVSYGLALPSTSSASVAGSFGPITIETRMNDGSGTGTSGPVRDVNKVFDTINTDVAPLAMTVETEIPTTSTTKIYPGETTEVTWTFTMT